MLLIDLVIEIDPPLRFGQKKTCFVYWLIQRNIKEEFIYKRQITKLS